jgi:hypothetical protein
MLAVLSLSLIVMLLWLVLLRYWRPVPVVGSRAAGACGWVGLALSVLVSSFFAMFAGGEALSEGVGALGHVLQTGLVVAIALLAVAVPRYGAVYALLGVAVVLVFRSMAGVIAGLPLILAGVLLWFGHPAPRRLAYLIAWSVPVAVGLLTLALAALG